MLLCAAGDELGRLFMSIAEPSPEKRINQKSGPIATEGSGDCNAKMPACRLRNWSKASRRVRRRTKSGVGEVTFKKDLSYNYQNF